MIAPADVPQRTWNGRAEPAGYQPAIALSTPTCQADRAPPPGSSSAMRGPETPVTVMRGNPLAQAWSSDDRPRYYAKRARRSRGAAPNRRIFHVTNTAGRRRGADPRARGRRICRGPARGRLPAPAFTLQDQSGKSHALSDYKGKWVVLYFYPKDNTPGCTTQACEFRDNIFAYREIGATILGVSVDDVASHKAFSEQHSLPFPILADTDKSVTTAYGTLKEYVGIAKMARRDTFIIDPQGRIAKHYQEVEPSRPLPRSCSRTSSSSRRRPRRRL